VLPGVEAEAVESADAGEEEGGGKKGWADPIGEPAEDVDGGGCGRGARDGGDEDSGGEEDAYGEFFRKAASVAAGGRMGVDEEHPGGEERGEESVEMERAGIEMVKQCGEGYGAEQEDGDKRGAIAVMEAVARFKVWDGVVSIQWVNVGHLIQGMGVEATGIEQAGVEQTVSGVDHPDG